MATRTSQAPLTNLTIRVDPPILRKLATIAKAHKRTRTSMIRVALSEWVEQNAAAKEKV